jgi:hypothetical protein
VRKGTGGGRFCGETAQNRATQQAARDVAGVPGAARLDAGGGCPNSVSGRPRVPRGCVSRPGARRQSRGGVVAAVSRSAGLFKFSRKTVKNGRLQRLPVARAALFRHQGVRGELLMGTDPNFVTSRRREGVRRPDGSGVVCAMLLWCDLYVRASEGGVWWFGGRGAVQYMQTV